MPRLTIGVKPRVETRQRGWESFTPGLLRRGLAELRQALLRVGTGHRPAEGGDPSQGC